jgi:flagellar P-ring protein precursor FlgI
VDEVYGVDEVDRDVSTESTVSTGSNNAGWLVRKSRRSLVSLALAVAAVASLPSPARATRIRDLCDVVGVRPNQLRGYGLVVGLSGTGDSQRASMTPQAIIAMLQRLGVQVDGSRLRVRNVAAVMVTASLPPFARNGSRVDVTVASLGDATSLHGGLLLQTPLLGADNSVYAVAQGSLVVSGFSAGDSGGSQEIRNVPTAGRIPAGALVEREVSHELPQAGQLLLALRNPDFTTATRIAAAINQDLGAEVADAHDPGTVRVTVSPEWTSRTVALLARVEQIDVAPASQATVVINQRTGTVVVGEAVTLRECALAHGGLTIRIREEVSVSQPGPLATGGTTAVVSNTEVTAAEDAGQLVGVPSTTTVADLVQALNVLGVSPRDLVAIFQALHSAGALQARVEVQ